LSWTEYSRLWRSRNPERAKQNDQKRYLKNRKVKKPRIFASEPSPPSFRVSFD
jgi:hypothetical protein